MQRYSDVVQDVFGNAINGASVTVRVQNASPGTGALATIYSDNGVTPIGGSVVSTDAAGRFGFWVADGRYDLTVTGTGITTYTLPDVEIADQTQKASGDLQAKFLTVQADTLQLDVANADVQLTRSAADTLKLAAGDKLQLDTLESSTANPASAGQVRLASADTIQWRDNANSTNLSLSKDTDDQIRFGGKWIVINEQGPAAAIVGTGADATVYSYSMPANKMLASKGIRVTVQVKHSTGTGNPAYKLKLGATTLETITPTNDSVSDSWFQFLINNNAGVQNAQHWTRTAVTGSATPLAGANSGTSAENTANALTLVFTFNVAASDQVTPKQFLVELLN